MFCGSQSVLLKVVGLCPLRSMSDHTSNEVEHGNVFYRLFSRHALF